MIDRQEFVRAGFNEAQIDLLMRMQQDTNNRVPYMTPEQSAETDRLQAESRRLREESIRRREESDRQREESRRANEEASQRRRADFAELNRRLDRLGAPPASGA